MVRGCGGYSARGWQSPRSGGKDCRQKSDCHDCPERRIAVLLGLEASVQVLESAARRLRPAVLFGSEKIRRVRVTRSDHEKTKSDTSKIVRLLTSAFQLHYVSDTNPCPAFYQTIQAHTSSLLFS
jgi:hypothetical protein